MDPTAEFLAELEKPDDEIDLARAALLLAAEEYPGLSVPTYLAILDELAHGVDLTGGESPRQVVEAISTHLFGRLGFHGNHADYYDPRNSYLNEVLDRRLGIPITLATVYIAVAARRGHRVEGVNFPSHFLLAYRDLFVDPFEGGAIVTPADCAARLAAIHGRVIRLEPEHFERVGPRMILRRILNNLRATYLAQGDHVRVRRALMRMQACAEAEERLGWARKLRARVN